MGHTLSRPKEMQKFQVTLEVHGYSYILTRKAASYAEMVNDINRDFGNVVILHAKDIE